MRDRTEMLALQRELDLTKSTTDTLRAQAHEFSNRMHVVSGLIALEEYDGVRNYIRQITDDSTTLTTNVVTRACRTRPWRRCSSRRRARPPSGGWTSSSTRPATCPRSTTRSPRTSTR